MEENTLLLLRDKDIDWGAQALDDAFAWKEIVKNPVWGAILEGADKPAGKISLNFLNKRVSPFIPDEYKDEVHIALDDVQDGDENYEEAISQAFVILSDLTDKFNVSDFVAGMIDALIGLLKSILIVWAEKKSQDD